MKKLFLIIPFFCLWTISVSAQNYKCFPKDSGIYWFTNIDHYLRGIRIDSILASGADTLYFPYHTDRYDPVSGYFDTAGASWIGKKIIQKTDGTFLFGNAYNDTVIIKTQAQLGDSWEFYNDSGKTNYIATVTSLDTMTILGSLDSIKKITIKAYRYGLDSNDLVNNFSFILSKDHGFAQIFDLYNFPYHTPADTFVTCTDSYFQLVNNFWGILTPQIFSITEFHVPTKRELFDYHVGDVLEYETSTYDFTWGSCPITDYSGVEYDSIVSRIYIDSSLTILQIQQRKNKSTFLDSIYLDSTSAFLIRLLPEEHNQLLAFHYDPKDTAYCYTGKLFRSEVAFVFEGCDDLAEYKAGLGVLDTDFCQYSYCPGGIGPSAETIYKLIYSVKDGVKCGAYLDVPKEPILDGNIVISPNPANSELSVRVDNEYNQLISYSLINIVGQPVELLCSSNNTVIFHVGDLPAGIYFVEISNLHGSQYVNKVSIVH